MNKQELSLADIRSRVIVDCGLSLNDLMSDCRPKPLVEARGLFVYLAKSLTTNSYPYIAKMCGYSDHTSAMHVHRKTAIRMETDVLFVNRVKRLESELLCQHIDASHQQLNEFTFNEVDAEQMVDAVSFGLRGFIVDTVQREVAKLKDGYQHIKPIIIQQGWTDENSTFATAVSDVVSAVVVLDDAKFSDGQGAARNKLDAALKLLRIEFHKTQNIIERVKS